MPSIPILFGTETGNAEYCAKELKSALQKAGYAATVTDMSHFAPEALVGADLVLIVTSTYGKGDPPANAEKTLKYLQEGTPDLQGLQFGVCALGDSTYQDFAQCGRDFDRLLDQRGAHRVIELCICDIDVDDFFPTFRQNVFAWVESQGEKYRGSAEAEQPQKKGFFQRLFGWLGGNKPAIAPSLEVQAAAVADPVEPHVQATVLRRRRLNSEGSEKETMHYELSLAGTGLSYEPGDCIAVHPENDPAVVEWVTQRLGLDPTESVQLDGRALSLRDALASRDFQRLTTELTDFLARAKGPLAEPGADVKAYRHARHLAEALSEHSNFQAWTAQELVDHLRATPPRLYSIASSQKVTPNEVHLTVETPRYTQDAFSRVGLASGWLCDRVKDGAKITIHRVSGAHFRLPSPEADVILVGPGTGIAPYRAFLIEREATSASGRNWLFFGHQHRATDFLYESELRGFQERGVLTRLDAAWSRDQAEKHYVYHLMEEAGAELWQWLQSGAVLYVCGDKQNMAADVRRALLRIAAREGQLSDAESEAWLSELEKAERYRLDVY